jgi:IS605 OrfB family transposase
MKEVDYKENQNLKEFEKKTPKEIRANAVQSVCDAYKSAFTNLKNGNIKYFKMKFKKKSTPRQTIELAPSNISLNNGVLKILPKTFKDECIIQISNKNKKKHKDLTIENNVDIVRQNGTYFAHILKAVEHKDKTVKEDYKMCGVDPGVRTFATSYSYSTKDNHTTIREYEHRVDLLKRLNNKMEKMKNRKKRVQKKYYNKIEKKKKYIVDSLHWNTINHLLLTNDIVFYGDIKSQDITKGNKNKSLNQDFNDLKFYVFKTRLKYKAETLAKQAIIVNESYTTKTCSCCGTINNNVGSSKIFSCAACKLVTGRDENASKNILMKGLFL